MTIYTTTKAIELVVLAPRLRGTCVSWATNIEVPGHVAAAVLTAADQRYALDTIAAGAKVSAISMAHFTRGNRADGSKWPELRGWLTAKGIAWRQSPREAAQQAARAKPEPATVAAKPATLAITADGNVTAAALPPAALAPSPMIAAPGEYATKTCTTKITTDPATGDYLITKRVPYGTPEHKAIFVKPKAA